MRGRGNTFGACNNLGVEQLDNFLSWETTK